MAKENANPQIYQVEEKRASPRRTPLDWSQLGTFGSITDVNDMEDVLATLRKSIGKQGAIIPTSSSDKAILQALVDCRQATNGKGVHLLRQAGLDIPISTHSKLIAGSGPIFQLAAEKTASIPSDISLQEGASTAATPQIKKKRKAQSDDVLTAGEVFDIIRNIQDPEHPHTLEQLGVVSLEQVELLETTSNSNSTMVNVRFTPTIPHCSMATLIGLCIRVKLWRSLPPSGKFKVNVQIEPGTHVSENAINKQLRDKERVCAALENKHLANVVNKCIRNGMNGGGSY
ncbi:iron-sulfur cluster assembly protein [Nitzschia inconspicua]|uniref:Iron-sulfur cluster assembly protein n=1 Tax=Nitzschia inconspicua TaxID=303405 RepID=A0A9K3M725_9STRA|nr:iron-sulfur cluster assembly protein [Nitzschia inconspicua]